MACVIYEINRFLMPNETLISVFHKLPSEMSSPASDDFFWGKNCILQDEENISLFYLLFQILC